MSISDNIWRGGKRLIIGLVVLVAVLIAVIVLLFGTRRSHAETMHVERVVPEGSTLTYSEGGVVVRTLVVPPGRVSVDITYGGPVRLGHGRARRR